MREAVLAVVHHAFTAMDLSRIEAGCLPENAPSRRLLEAAATSTRGSRRPTCRSTAAGGTTCSTPTSASTGGAGPTRAEPGRGAGARRARRSRAVRRRCRRPSRGPGPRRSGRVRAASASAPASARSRTIRDRDPIGPASALGVARRRRLIGACPAVRVGAARLAARRSPASRRRFRDPVAPGVDAVDLAAMRRRSGDLGRRSSATAIEAGDAIAGVDGRATRWPRDDRARSDQTTRWRPAKSMRRWPATAIDDLDGGRRRAPGDDAAASTRTDAGWSTRRVREDSWATAGRPWWRAARQAAPLRPRRAVLGAAAGPGAARRPRAVPPTPDARSPGRSSRAGGRGPAPARWPAADAASSRAWTCRPADDALLAALRERLPARRAPAGRGAPPDRAARALPGAGRSSSAPPPSRRSALTVRLCAEARVRDRAAGRRHRPRRRAADGRGAAPVILSLARMDRVRDVFPEENVLVVEAGAILADVQAAAEKAGRMFPLSLASEGSARIGGPARHQRRRHPGAALGQRPRALPRDRGGDGRGARSCTASPGCGRTTRATTCATS